MKANSSYSQASKRRSHAFARLNRSAAAILNLPLPRYSIVQEPVTAIANTPSYNKPPAPKSFLPPLAEYLEFRRRRADLLRSHLFDPRWYLQKNPDVASSGKDPLKHFLEHGVYEGRAPGPSFDSVGYLIRNPDVALARIEPWRHYFLHGKSEGRSAEAALDDTTPTRLLYRTPSTLRLAHNIDAFDANSLRGWAYNLESPEEKVEISLYIDDRLVARAVADEVRPDLVAVGIGDGRSGYDMPLPRRAYFDGGTVAVYARIGGGDILIAQRTTSSDASNGSARVRALLYLDVSDLLHYMSKQRRVSGIQRVQIGLIFGLLELPDRDYDIGFCTRDDLTQFVDVPSEQLRAFLTAENLSDADWSARLEALRSAAMAPTDFRSGDTLLIIGAPWAVANHMECVKALKERGVGYLQVLYDIVPIVMPEVVDAEVIRVFSSTMASVIAYADHVFAISAFSKAEFESAAREVCLAPPPCDVIRLGGTLSESTNTSPKAIEDLKQRGLHGEFVLCVGTIEPRKNHILLYNIWRRMLADTRAVVPKLVLVGRTGWYMEAFVRALEATDYLDKHVVIISDASDELLSALYRECLFTVFPSHYEGWGLPIVESFAYGKVCVCSSTSSMPEAGQDFAVYIDPNNATGAYATIRELIEDRTLLKARERDIKRRFAPRTWLSAAQDFSPAISSALRRIATAGPVQESAMLDTGRRYRIEWPEDTNTAKRQFASDVAFVRLSTVLEGSYWFPVERDRCWSCGSVAPLRLTCASPAAGVLLELCLPPALRGSRCAVKLNGGLLGTITMEAGYCVLHVVLPSNTCRNTFFIEIATEKDSLQPFDSEKRLLGPGILSLFLYADSFDSALRAFLRGEKWSRNADEEIVRKSIVHLSGVRKDPELML